MRRQLRARSRATKRYMSTVVAPPSLNLSSITAPPATADALADAIVNLKLVPNVNAAAPGIAPAQSAEPSAAPAVKSATPSPAAPPSLLQRLPAAAPLPPPKWEQPAKRPVVPWDKPLDPELVAVWAEPCGASIDLGLKLKDVLRHQAQAEGLEISADGWMKVSEALKYVNKPGIHELETKYSEKEVRHEVAVNAMQRFQLKELKGQPYIRAVRGHTMKGISSGMPDTKKKDMKDKEPEDSLPLKQAKTWVPPTPRLYDEEERQRRPVARDDFRLGYIDYFRLIQEAEEEKWKEAHGGRARPKATRARPVR